MTTSPRLSVVIVATRAGAPLHESFAAVKSQAAGDVEIVVVARRAPAEQFESGPSTCTVRVMPMADDASIPEMYAAGLQSARGTLVAVTNDRFVADPDWIGAIMRAHVEHPRAGVIGGAVESSATDTLLDRAVYYCEYAQFGGAVPAGRCGAPGPNASYTAAALVALAPLLEEPTWEAYWHQHLIGRGVEIERDPRIRVRHRCPRTLSGFLRERYLFSRALAGERVRRAAWTTRIVRGLGSLALPPVLLARLLRRFVATGDGRGRGSRRAWMTVPLLALFTIPWAWGEVVGSLWGTGAATRRIR